MNPKFREKRKSIVSRFRSLLRGENEGGALVELAVTLPVVMIIMTGIFSFSIALYQKLQLAEAVSVGGRFLAVDRGDTDPCAATTAKIDAAAPGLTAASINLTYTLNGVSQGSGTTSCPGKSGAANADMVAGGYAQIVASYPCSLTVYGMKFSTCSLGTQITEVVQ